MRIGINTIATPLEKIGVGKYIDNLLNNLQVIDRKNEYIIFISKKTKNLFRANTHNFKKVILNVSPQPSYLLLFWQPIILYNVFKYKIDVLHLTNTMPLVLKICKTINTIYDLQEFNIKKYGKFRTIYRKAINFLAAHIADGVITVSNNSKQDIIKFLKVPPQKVWVTYEGISSNFKKLNTQECMEKLSTKFNISSNFILSVGELHPGKNFVELIEAFNVLRNKYQMRDYTLVIVGKNGRHFDKIFNKVLELGLQKEVVFTGYVLEEDLPIFYNTATLCVFLSLYEGFGFPPLEAMACGCPTITPNVSSMPEVLGDATILVNPYNIEEIANTMFNVLKNKSLQQQLIGKGFSHIKRYEWRKTARETLDIYTKIFHSRKNHRKI